MSNHAYYEPEPRKSHTGLAITVTILIAVMILFLNFVLRHNPHANWHVSQANVLATRITLQERETQARRVPQKSTTKAKPTSPTPQTANNTISGFQQQM